MDIKKWLEKVKNKNLIKNFDIYKKLYKLIFKSK